MHKTNLNALRKDLELRDIDMTTTRPKFGGAMCIAAHAYELIPENERTPMKANHTDKFGDATKWLGLTEEQATRLFLHRGIGVNMIDDADLTKEEALEALDVLIATGMPKWSNERIQGEMDEAFEMGWIEE